MHALRIVGRAAVSFYEELFFYFILGLGHVFSWVLIIPGPFVLAGVYTIGQKAVRGLGVKWSIIWEGIKQFGPRSLLLFLIVIAGYGVIASNLWFYNTPDVSPFAESVAAWTTPIFFALALVWTGVTFYAQSFLMELEDPKMLLVLRNSLFLTILKPVQTLFFLIVSLAALAISVALPILLIVSPAFVSVLSLTAVRTFVGELTERAEQQREAEEADADDESDDESEPSSDQI